MVDVILIRNIAAFCTTLDFMEKNNLANIVYQKTI